MHDFLQNQVQPFAAQIAAVRVTIGKAADSQDEQDAVEQILAQLDFTGWAVLAGDVDGIMADLVRDGGTAALAQIGLGVDATEGAIGIINDAALAYSRDRSAELVGMRRDGLARLIPNPNAEWQITDSTREYLRADVTQALQDGWSNDQLASKIADAYGFSDSRAQTIARTETQMAGNAGQLAAYKASGVVDGKQWLTAEDDKVEEECLANGEAGPNGDGVLLDLAAIFPSGDDAPPAHPNCRCVIIPYIDWENQPTNAGSESTTEE